ncbi:hypothetical protein ACTZWW_19385 [Salinarimonas sp. NSM]|uniref:hypothetical protein n=1 Tax=Salinarimonas sp. NSM TaxID=3458003 RepID=UPI00403584EF
MPTLFVDRPTTGLLARVEAAGEPTAELMRDAIDTLCAPPELPTAARAERCIEAGAYLEVAFLLLERFHPDWDVDRLRRETVYDTVPDRRTSLSRVIAREAWTCRLRLRSGDLDPTHQVEAVHRDRTLAILAATLMLGEIAANRRGDLVVVR